MHKCVTSVLRALASAATVKEAIENGICTINLFDLAVVFGAGTLVLRQLHDMRVRPCHTTTLRYAAYTGNLDAVRLICENEYCDACDIFEAVRGGHIDVLRCAVNNSVPSASVPTVAEIPAWRTNVYDSAFVRHCRCLASINTMNGVTEKLDAFLRPKRYKAISCVDLAIAMRRPDMAVVLRASE